MRWDDSDDITHNHLRMCDDIMALMMSLALMRQSLDNVKKCVQNVA
jgi:hypothetical protein